PQHPRTFVADARSPSLIQLYFGAQAPVAITAADITVPVLLVHAEYNKTVPHSQSRTLNEALQKAGKPVAYTELTACDHDLTAQNCRLSTAQAVTDFLATHNPAR